jgi:hypothetical protein
MLARRLTGAPPRVERRNLIIPRYTGQVTHAAPAPAKAPAKAEASCVTLIADDGHTESMRLVNGRIQLSAAKEAFGLATIRLGGKIEPVDAMGFTLAEFEPAAVVTVSGQRLEEAARLRAEIEALRAELGQLSGLRDELRALSSLDGLRAEVSQSMDDLRNWMLAGPTASSDDLAVIKRLVAEMVLGSRDGGAGGTPDFAKTSLDHGYNFEHWWEGRELARDVIHAHSEVSKKPRKQHFDVHDHEEMLEHWQAT